MRIDLERALADVAATVDDDVTAERMTGQVRHMVARVRRRRAVRHTAQGIASVGVVAVIGVAAASLGGPQGGPAPEVPPATATPERTAPPVPTPAPTCTDGVPAPTTGPLTLELAAAPEAEQGREVVVESALRNTGGEDLDIGGWGTVWLVAVADGRVVGEMADGGTIGGMIPADGVLRPGDVGGATTTARFDSCDEPATALPPGGYTLIGTLLAEVDGETVEVVSEPVPFTVTGPEGDASAPTAEDALQTLLTDAQETDGPFPVCGTKPWLDDGMPALELDYVAGASDLVDPGGATLPGGVVLKTTEGRYAIADASPLARVVLLRDGAVVGVPFLDPEDVVDVDLVPGETQPFDLVTTTALCGTGEGGTGEALRLPAGEYTAIAALDLTVKEIGGPGEEPDGTTYPYTAVSEPVTITVP
jgi:hypothetical protein